MRKKTEEQTLNKHAKKKQLREVQKALGSLGITPPTAAAASAESEPKIAPKREEKQLSANIHTKVRSLFSKSKRLGSSGIRTGQGDAFESSSGCMYSKPFIGEGNVQNLSVRIRKSISKAKAHAGGIQKSPAIAKVSQHRLVKPSYSDVRLLDHSLTKNVAARYKNIVRRAQKRIRKMGGGNSMEA